MIPPKWIDHDTLEAPRPVYDADTKTFGDGIVQLHPGDEGFSDWSRYLIEQLEMERPVSG